MNASRRRANAKLAAWLAALALCGHGCGGLVPGPGVRALDEAHEESRTAPPVPDSVRNSLIPPLVSGERQADEAEARFDISVDRAPADAFFRGLVEGTPYNVVVHPDVRAEISLELKSVSVPEVMESVAKIYGVAITRSADVYHVTPLQLVHQVYELDYLFLRRDGRSETRVSSGQVTEQAGRSDDDDNGNGNDDTVTTGDEESGAVSGSVISTTSQSDLWEEIGTSLRAIVGEGEGRQVMVSPSSGIVVVRALPGEQAEVAEYLRSVQESLQRQVVLEAKVIEITLEDRFRSGINWGALASLQEDALLLGQTGGGIVLDPPFLSEIAGNLGDARGPFPSSTDTSAFGGVFTATAVLQDSDGSDAVTAFIELLESQGDTQVLSSPRISTLNNQKAVIKVGSDEFFVTDVSTTTVTGTTTTTSPTVTLTPFFSGIALDVTPQIDANGFVTLHIHPSVSQVDDQTKTISLGSTTLNLPLAFSTIRETDTIVRAHSGQLIVIGGLMQDNTTDRRASVPFLGRVPPFSWIFGQNLEDLFRKELVILLRPHVVQSETWTKSIEESVKRTRDMKGRQLRRGLP
jgi:MSHA biogenesis protein MshL